MAKEFCQRGIASAAVYSGENGAYAEERNEAIRKLKNGEIRVIFSVDMFNEGVDIASLDMVMFVRPTESPVVFLQQLGRGLRLYKGKEYLNVLDFIGNYEKAGKAPLLLSGEQSFSKKGSCEYQDLEYPDDCIVDFDMCLIDLFKEMDKKKLTLKMQIRREYYRVKELLDGKRPSRMDLLLFEGIENEKERIYKEKRKLNPVFIELIENTLEIYRGIFAVMCRKKGNQLSVSKIKRVDRKASLMAYLKGYTESFVSCTKGEYDDEFAAKNNIILLEIESLENIPYVDYQQVVTMQEYRNYDEKEVLFPPFLSLKVSEIELTTKDNHIKDMYGKPPVGKYQLKMEEFPDYRNAITSSREELLNKILDEKDKAVLCLEHMNNNMWKEDYHEYVEWKNNLHSYLKLIYSDMWYGEREK